MGGYGGGAALKAGQPWVAAAELSRLGGSRLLADPPGKDEQRLYRGCSIAPSVSQEESVDHDNSPVISARSLGSCQTVTRVLRSEAVTKPISLAPWQAPCPRLRACLVGQEGGKYSPKGQGLPTQGDPGRPGPLCSGTGSLCCQEKGVAVRTSGWKSDTPGAASRYPLGPHHLHPIEEDAEAQKL